MMDTKTNNQVQIDVKQLFLDLQIHYKNLRSFHWNVSGPEFYTLHIKFEEFYDNINLKIDETAERLLAIGMKPDFSIMDTLTQSKIEEKNNLSSGNDMVKHIIVANKQIIQDVKSILQSAGEVNDTGSEDIFSPYVTQFEKENWMLRAYIN